MKYFFIPIFFLIATKGFSQNNETKNSTIREMSTDRPDVTESAYTVPVGHFQLETDLVKFSTEKIPGVTFKETDVNAFNLKYGISKSIDLQIVIESIVSTRIITPVFKESKTGLGDLTFRIKKNIFGNDKGKIALAVMPFINIPAGRRDSKFSSGIVIPLAISLGNKWDAGAEVQTVIGQEATGRKLVAANLFSATAGHPISNNFDFFIETVVTNSQKEWALLGNGGIIYALSPDFKMDAGFNLGLAGSNAQIYFLGLSFRI
jgi:hypothetical protein